MAIRDLLSLCPICLMPSGFQPDGRGERCRGCGARFHRGSGAGIVAKSTAGTRTELTAAEWLDRVRRAPATDRPASLGPEPVEIRLAAARVAIRRNGRLLGWRDELGPPRHGTLRLERDRLCFDGEDGSIEWALDTLTAIQPTAASLQIKAKGTAVASVRFPHASVRLWEDAIHDRIRQAWRDAGRGEIVEFQPRITTR